MIGGYTQVTPQGGIYSKQENIEKGEYYLQEYISLNSDLDSSLAHQKGY